VGSANGNEYKNGGPRTGVAEAFARMTKGEDVLDAVIAGVNIVELDPLDDSVGYGGLPNADGVVQLDSCCMHGPKKRAGGVACIEGVRTPSMVARAVAELTDHHLIVGQGAQDLARRLGFTVEDDLNTENSRKKWLEWKRRIDPEHYLDPAKRERAAAEARAGMVADGLLDPLKMYGTINMNGVNAKGEVCGVTTTSGLAFKIPGRVGDSPIRAPGSTWTAPWGRRLHRPQEANLNLSHHHGEHATEPQGCRHGDSSDRGQYGGEAARDKQGRPPCEPRGERQGDLPEWPLGSRGFHRPAHPARYAVLHRVAETSPSRAHEGKRLSDLPPSPPSAPRRETTRQRNARARWHDATAQALIGRGGPQGRTVPARGQLRPRGLR
jgi:isoaspartyl peptidase/L-asparaginase-like protein (Ntn-hydrolase superfamily)